jgi:hypothetical protein
MKPNFVRARRLPRRVVSLAALMTVAFGPLVAHAQGSPAPTEAPAPAPAPSPAPAPAPTAPAETSDAALEEKLAKQQQQIDALVAASKAADAQVAALQSQAAASDEGSSFNRLLSFWGFSDLSFGGIDYDNNHALYKVQTPSKMTFFSSGINLYAKSEMTRTLSAMVETQLTYSPNGYASGWPANINIGNTTIAQQGTLTRVDTSTRGPYSQLLYRQDGLFIERAYLEWKPADWFGIRAGRFLTPFGIWNEDHGSPVLIGVDYPQFMNFNIVPIWQLGLEAFGSVDVTDDLRIEYAATLANSNGPEDEYKDLTNMKALGARIKLVYNPEPVLFRIGGYAYYNQYRDTQDNIQIQLTPQQTLDPAYSPSFGSYSTTNAAYNETILTADAELRIRRLRIIAEFARQTVIYQMPTAVDSQDQLLKGVPFNVTIYDPSHYGLGGYVMAAYEIPFHTSLLDFTVMPYAGYDYVAPSTTVPVRNNTQIRGGLNVKPSPWVTMKLEVSRLLPENKSIASDATAIMSQLAFSF